MYKKTTELSKYFWPIKNTLKGGELKIGNLLIAI